MTYKIPHRNPKPKEIKENPKFETFKRDKKQEGYQVYRWYENKNGDIVSVVEGYFPNEANMRISSGTGKFKSFEIRGSKSIMLDKSDEELIATANRFIEREKYREN
jgi:hypothetical protein